MNKIPESYYFYKEHLRKAKEEKAKLQKEYNSKIDGLNNEINFLKEKIDAQHTMISQSIEYVLKLEKDIKSVGADLDGENQSSAIMDE
jgi:peptidoglycan hydrolase CwlO-like protein